MNQLPAHRLKKLRSLERETAQRPAAQPCGCQTWAQACNVRSQSIMMGLEGAGFWATHSLLLPDLGRKNLDVLAHFLMTLWPGPQDFSELCTVLCMTAVFQFKGVRTFCYFVFLETGSQYIAQASSKFMILLSQLPQCWNYGYMSPNPTKVI